MFHQWLPAPPILPTVADIVRVIQIILARDIRYDRIVEFNVATAYHYMLSPVRLSVFLIQGWISQKKQLKLESWNFHHTVALPLIFAGYKFHPEILMGGPSEGVKQGRGGEKQAIL